MTAVGIRVARRIIRLLWKVVSISTVEPNVGLMFVVLGLHVAYTHGRLVVGRTLIFVIL